MAIFVAGLEVLAVQGEVLRVFAREHGIGRGAGGDKNGVGGKVKFAGQPLAVRTGERATLTFALILGLCGEINAAHRAIVVCVNRQGRETFGKADAFLQRFFHLLVVERVRGAVDQAATIGNGGATPALQQFDDARLALFRAGAFPFRADRAGMCQEFFGDFAFLRSPCVAHRILVFFRCQRLVALQEFLRLDGVVRERLGGGVDGGETAADDDHRQAHLHVGDGIGLGGAGELQGHEEVRGGAHAAGKAVGDVEHGGLARAHRKGNVVEAHAEGIVGIERAAEAHAAEQGELPAPFEQQAYHLEEILVPAHGDAVLGHAAEASHDAIIQGFVQRIDVLDRIETR